MGCSHSATSLKTSNPMNDTDYFTSLPANIAVIIMTDYLSLKSIGGLDCAFTGTESRKRFLALYKEEAFVLKIKQHSVVSFNPSFCAWALSRSVSVGAITLHKSFTSASAANLISYVKDCGSHVKFFNTGLDRADTMSVTQYKSIVKELPALKILTGVPISFVTKSAMEVTRKSCPEISSFHVIEDDESDSPGSVGALVSLVENGGLTQLETLRIPVARDIRQSLEAVAANCPNLEGLFVSPSDNLSIEGCDSVLVALSANCRALQTLSLPADSVSDEGLVALSSCSALTSLTLSDCNLVTAVGFEAVSKGCPQLSELTLTGIEYEKQQEVQRLLHTTQFSNLQKLVLKYCTALMDEDIVNIAITSPKLTHVHMYMCFNVADFGVRNLSARCPLLTSLCITGTQVTDDTFAQLAETSTQLTRLDVTPVEPFAEREGVLAAFSALTNLQRLDVSSTNLLNDASVVMALISNCYNLRVLNVKNCELCDDFMQLMEGSDDPFQYVGEGVFER